MNKGPLLLVLVLLALACQSEASGADKPSIVVTRVATPPKHAAAPAPRFIESETVHTKKGDFSVKLLLPTEDAEPSPDQPSLIIQKQRGLLEAVEISKRAEGPPPSPKAPPKAPAKQVVFVIDTKADKDVRFGIVAPAPAPTPKSAPPKVTHNTKEEGFANTVAAG